VTAGYADRKRINSSPKYLEIPRIAAESGSDIAMLDTYIKDDKGLFDFLSVEELIKFKEKAHKFNLKIALAGRLMKEDLPFIKQISPDIIGVRSLVCEKFDRNNGMIKKELINSLLTDLYK